MIFQVANDALGGTPGSSNSNDLHDLLKFLRQVFALKDKWATAYKPKHFSCDLHSLARADAVNQLIASKLYARASIIELIKLVEDIDKRIEYRCLQTA